MERMYAHILLFVLAGAAFVIFSLVASYLLRVRNPDARKENTYECGMEPIGTSWVQFNVRYYVIALIFVIFDVETIFLMPWAVVFGELGLVAFLEMAVFLLILIAGLVYAWRKGALEWTS